LNEKKKEDERRFDQLTNAIEGLAIENDEKRELKKVKMNDSIHFSQHDLGRSSLFELRRENTGKSSMQVKVEEIEDENGSLKKQKVQHETESFKVSRPSPLDSSEELSHYCTLVKNLLNEIEAVQYKLDHRVRHSFGEGIKRSHRRTTHILTAKHGHERICRIFGQAWAEKIDVSDTGRSPWRVS
jgi:hypothetical protein